ncbi:LytTR family transcriptional regulator DNA-binding domain-containing protein [Pediococcus argentinicus]|uniref:LytTR family transcriptional regulator DNA-binding domain-containing protein n=1 Tax=Pediococcus argentinicus TaxID=480391 RepID=UPI0009F87D23|nr:LytTR family transcriptional regulator [Pediococcus argentinicus]
MNSISHNISFLIKCHRSFLINPNNISIVDYDTNCIHFKSGNYCWFTKKYERIIKESVSKIGLLG